MNSTIKLPPKSGSGYCSEASLLIKTDFISFKFRHWMQISDQNFQFFTLAFPEIMRKLNSCYPIWFYLNLIFNSIFSIDYFLNFRFVLPRHIHIAHLYISTRQGLKCTLSFTLTLLIFYSPYFASRLLDRKRKVCLLSLLLWDWIWLTTALKSQFDMSLIFDHWGLRRGTKIFVCLTNKLLTKKLQNDCKRIRVNTSMN